MRAATITLFAVALVISSIGLGGTTKPPVQHGHPTPQAARSR
jgi:hypothetical protein